MLARYLDLAASKAHTEEEAAALRSIAVIASRLDEQERTFEDRINASKAARGGPPTKLSKSEREEIDQYAADASELAAEQWKTFESLDSAWTIVSALHMGLDSDVTFWSRAHLKAHPAEAVMVQELARAKVTLRDALSAYLEHFPGDDG